MALLVIDIDLVIIEVTIITYLWLISLASVIDLLSRYWNNDNKDLEQSCAGI
ncbi:MAG TPA: hypothetical protein VEW92_14530 [Nitrososphaeraceae archaeon]|nr:hypothetical protein [Nitrososphaeraceae archaeon]